MLLLFIEDNEQSVEPAVNRVHQDHADFECIVKDFDKASKWLETNRPDVVSLDVVLDGASGDARLAGQNIHDVIWKDNFCPIIVYSAQPDELTIQEDHPFVQRLLKGSGSPAQFSDILQSFRPHVDALRAAETQVRREFSVAMRELAPSVFEQVSAPEERQRIIARSGRRRLAAQMDDFSDYEGDDAKRLAPWEHYLCPPVAKDLLLGDILRSKESDATQPDAFRIVLTPSCDLVAAGQRRPKVSNVLTAKCIDMKTALSKAGMQLNRETRNDDTKLSEYKNRLTSSLSQAFMRSIVPFPKFTNLIPTMAADLRQLELISFENIAGENSVFVRVASIDSPFRELISWAYMQTGCRPGLPDRNLDDWCDEIVNLY